MTQEAKREPREKVLDCVRLTNKYGITNTAVIAKNRFGVFCTTHGFTVTLNELLILGDKAKGLSDNQIKTQRRITNGIIQQKIKTVKKRNFLYGEEGLLPETTLVVVKAENLGLLIPDFLDYLEKKYNPFPENNFENS